MKSRLILAVLLLPLPAALQAADAMQQLAVKPNVLFIAIDDLRRELDAWRKDVGAEMMRPNPDYDPAAELPKKGKKKAKPGARE